MHAQPYVPGRVRGLLRHGAASASCDAIVVVAWRELAGFDEPCSALVVVDGKPFSHFMTHLAGAAIPTIIISGEQARRLPADVELVLDGHQGLLFDPQLLSHYPAVEITPPARFAPFITRDGEHVFLRASVGDCLEMQRALSCGASAIGALNLESLGRNSGYAPGADFFVNALSDCCHAAASLPLIARLPDFASDKLPKWLRTASYSMTDNSGRGTRIYDREPFKSLLDNILSGVDRCAERYDIRLLVPFVDNIDTFTRWRDRIKTRVVDTVAIGAMLETVSAVEQLPRFFDAADFIAIGTNDLTADLLGCARDSDAMNAYAPVIYRQIQRIARLAGHRTREIQIAGQLPRMPGVLRVLLGLGYRIFSLAPVLLPYLGETIKQTDTATAAELAERVCQARDASEVKELLLDRIPHDVHSS